MPCGKPSGTGAIACSPPASSSAASSSPSSPSTCRPTLPTSASVPAGPRPRWRSSASSISSAPMPSVCWRQKHSKRMLLCSIYLGRAVAIALFLLVPPTPAYRAGVLRRHGPAVAVDGAADLGARGADVRRAPPGPAVRLRLLQPSGGRLHRRLAGRRAVRAHRLVRRRLVASRCAEPVRRPGATIRSSSGRRRRWGPSRPAVEVGP